MNRLEIGPYIITYDRVATMDCYAHIQRGDAERCGCKDCMNFILARNTVFPVEFLGYLSKFGIDYRKEAEVYHFGKNEKGNHSYGGIFYFIGMMQTKSDSESDADISLCTDSQSFSFSVTNGRSLAQNEFDDRELVEITFKVEVPWLLDESEMTQ